MALEKQLCCFGVVLVALWLGTSGVSSQWTPIISSSSIKNPQTPRQPPQKTPEVIPQTPAQRPPPRPAQWPAQIPQAPAQKPAQRPAQIPQTPAQSPQTPAQRPATPPQRPRDPPMQINICNVLDSDRIQCGLSGTSAAECQKMNCCFDGSQCYYGNTVTLHCTLDAQIILVVSKEVTLPRLNLDTVVFLGGSGEPNCRPVDSNSGFAIYQFTPTACGTRMREENDQVIYENQMTSSYEVGIGPRGSITRDSFYEVSIQCRYTGQSVKALLVEILFVPPPFGVDQPGPIRVELRLGNGVCPTKGCVEESVAYTSYYSQSDYPVTKVLRDPVYVEVRLLERTDPNIVLTLGNCWTTPYHESTSMPQWDLLVEGCPYMDDRYLTTLVPISQDVAFPSHYRRFILKMFTFVDVQFSSPPQETVYIHCKISVCQPSAGASCEPLCSRFKRDVSAVKQEEAAVIVSSGAVRIKA
ncbi:zona pellucida sperm-binding protein 4-like isoform X1 [Alosa sapidissima]|uniref:zona pellucida sperm-binding protein 4-like isoform X1 n=1 Tax=Alosa sapidissima TaxID=34773 RepID=UPI001C08B15B|nr:zona pellucida sperm-binding protein 4-like isoform X1 [Alosa sapidissima]